MRVLEWLVGVGLSAAWWVAPTAGARSHFGPTRVTRITLGNAPPGGVDRVDARRSGKSPWPLPDRPTVVWRGEVPGGVLGAVGDGRGNIVAASLSGSLVELDRRGRLSWRAPLTALSSGSPAVSADGRRWVMTRDGQIHAFSASGALLVRLALEPGPATARANLLPLWNSQLLVSQGRAVRWLSAGGKLLAEAILESTVVQCYESDGQVWLVDMSGNLYSWSGTQAPKVTRSLGVPRGAPAVTPEGTWLWNDAQRLFEVSPGLSNTRTWFTASDSTSASGVTITGASAALLGRGSSVVRGTADGQFQRIVLGAPTRTPTPSASPLGDPAGNLAMTDGIGRLVLVDAAGSVQPVADAACTEPAALVPLGPTQFALVCASGTVAGIGSVQ